MNDSLGAVREFIASEAAKPFDWNKTNCGITADRWMTLALGYSPFRRYGFVLEGGPEDWGGIRIAVAVNRVMRACGLHKTAEPKPGDVGIILHRGKLCIGIHAGNVWFSRDDDGLIGAPLTATWKAWKVV